MPNTINTRIQLKYDLLGNWMLSSFIPLKGEVCIAEIPSGTNDSGLTPPTIGIKIGDGEKTFSQLSWIQALAGDVYPWAKHDSIVNDDTRSALQSFISTSVSDSNTLYRIQQGTGNDINKYYLQKKDLNEADYSNVPNSIIDLSTIFSKLTGAMHFIGFSTTAVTDGGVEQPTINNNIITDLNNGDVIIYQEASTNDDETTIIVSKEFVWTGTNWELLGDEGSYVLKGSITNSDIASNANIDQSKIDGLTTALNSKIEGIQVPDATEASGFKNLTVVNKKVQLSNIAETGNINDLNQTPGDYIILNCGSATVLVDNLNSGG